MLCQEMLIQVMTLGLIEFLIYSYGSDAVLAVIKIIIKSPYLNCFRC